MSFYVELDGHRDHFRRAIKAAEAALDWSEHRPKRPFTVWEDGGAAGDRHIGTFKAGKRVYWNP